MTPNHLTEFPLGLAGKVYGSAMPFGLYDVEGRLLQEFKRATISMIVLLAELDECREKTGRNLVALYQNEGLKLLPLPIPNYGVPLKDLLSPALAETIVQATQGQNILIHCSAGLGRTAFFAALLAREVLGLSGADAIRWMGRYKPDALLTPPQILMILDDEP